MLTDQDVSVLLMQIEQEHIGKNPQNPTVFSAPSLQFVKNSYNRRTSNTSRRYVWIEIDGKTLCASDWAKVAGLRKSAITMQIKRQGLQGAIKSIKKRLKKNGL